MQQARLDIQISPRLVCVMCCGRKQGCEEDRPDQKSEREKTKLGMGARFFGIEGAEEGFVCLDLHLAQTVLPEGEVGGDTVLTTRFKHASQ